MIPFKYIEWNELGGLTLRAAAGSFPEDGGAFDLLRVVEVFATTC